jgi:hypothetical protein
MDMLEAEFLASDEERSPCETESEFSERPRRTPRD